MRLSLRKVAVVLVALSVLSVLTWLQWSARRDRVRVYSRPPWLREYDNWDNVSIANYRPWEKVPRLERFRRQLDKYLAENEALLRTSSFSLNTSTGTNTNDTTSPSATDANLEAPFVPFAGDPTMSTRTAFLVDAELRYYQIWQMMLLRWSIRRFHPTAPIVWVAHRNHSRAGPYRLTRQWRADDPNSFVFYTDDYKAIDEKHYAPYNRILGMRDLFSALRISRKLLGRENAADAAAADAAASAAAHDADTRLPPSYQSPDSPARQAQSLELLRLLDVDQWVLLDPDMLLVRPFARVRARPGAPIASHIEYMRMHKLDHQLRDLMRSAPDGQPPYPPLQNIGAPYVMHPSDLEPLVDRWFELTRKLHATEPWSRYWIIEMMAFCMAASEHRLDFQTSTILGVLPPKWPAFGTSSEILIYSRSWLDLTRVAAGMPYFIHYTYPFNRGFEPYFDKRTYFTAAYVSHALNRLLLAARN